MGLNEVILEANKNFSCVILWDNIEDNVQNYKYPKISESYLQVFDSGKMLKQIFDEYSKQESLKPWY